MRREGRKGEERRGKRDRGLYAAIWCRDLFEEKRRVTGEDANDTTAC